MVWWHTTKQLAAMLLVMCETEDSQHEMQCGRQMVLVTSTYLLLQLQLHGLGLGFSH